MLHCWKNHILAHISLFLSRSCCCVFTTQQHKCQQKVRYGRSIFFITAHETTQPLIYSQICLTDDIKTNQNISSFQIRGEETELPDLSSDVIYFINSQVEQSSLSLSEFELLTEGYIG